MGVSTTILGLYQPATDEIGWDVQLNNNFSILDDKTIVAKLTNKSGASVAQGDVVIVDTSNTNSFTTTTTAYHTGVLGVVYDSSIANNATGLVIVCGYAAKVNIANTVSRGDYLFTSTTAKQAQGSATVREGVLGRSLASGSAGGSVSAVIGPIPYAMPPTTATLPANIGTASAGTANTFSRSDHVHDIADGYITSAKMAAAAGRWQVGNLTASDAAAGLFSWQNTTGGNIIVLMALIIMTTKTTGACTANIGVAATAVASDNLMTGIDLNTGTAPLIFNNIDDKGVNGKSRQVVPNNQYVTGSKATGASAGLVGKYLIYYIAA